MSVDLGVFIMTLCITPMQRVRNDSAFLCPECEQDNFRSVNALKNHYRAQHMTGNIFFLCLRCGFAHSLTLVHMTGNIRYGDMLHCETFKFLSASIRRI